MWNAIIGILIGALMFPIFFTVIYTRRTGRIPELLRKLLLRWAYKRMAQPWSRRIPPETTTRPYMLRWWIWRWRKLTSGYLNNVLRSDDDRALHDHPWINCSLVLLGGYWEHMPDGPVFPGVPYKTKRVWRGPGSFVFRRKATYLHRLELDPERAKQETISLFITGPATRRWGFMDPEHGWIDARDWEDHNRRLGRVAGNVGRGRSEFAIDE